jgi:hypothetical protein
MTPMPTLTRFLRALVATLVVAGLVVPGASTALANGLGDLYVAAPGGVDEVFLKGEQIVTEVEIGGGASHLAFTNEGASLFVIDGEGGLQRIDIESISVAQSYSLTTDAAAIAHPKGTSLFIALAGEARLAVLPEDEDATTGGPTLSGAPDLLAADRHENRFVAAQAGHSWLDVVEPASAHVTNVTMDGDIVAIAIARDEGYAYVAMEDPNQVARVALATGKVDWRADLSGAPSALTAVPEAAIVAIDDGLFRVKGGKAAPWSTEATGVEGPVIDLATSDEGAYVYVATEERIIAVNVTMPDTKPAAAVALAETAWLAPVPKASSLVPNGGDDTDTGSGTGTGTGTGDGTGEDASNAPATDTEDEGGPLWHRSAPDPALLFGVGAAIVGVVLGGTYAVMRRTIGAS